MSKVKYTPDERRKILLEQRYISTAAELCAKWNVSMYRLNTWKKEFNYRYFIGTLRDMTIVAVHGGARTIPTIIDCLDYLNHARYTEPETLELLRGLQAEGIAKETNGEWFYDKTHSNDDRSFIF
jgi:hypothetical protein